MSKAIRSAKTGTSEKFDEPEKELRIGSCVAYAPADDPQIAVLIMVDEPTGGSVYGSIVAAPYVSAFLSNVLPYMGIEPEYSEKKEACQPAGQRRQVYRQQRGGCQGKNQRTRRHGRNHPQAAIPSPGRFAARGGELKKSMAKPLLHKRRRPECKNR